MPGPYSIGETTELFGCERCLFGSNYPIEKLWTSYAGLVTAYRNALASYPEAAQQAMLAGNAQRIYRLT